MFTTHTKNLFFFTPNYNIISVFASNSRAIYFLQINSHKLEMLLHYSLQWIILSGINNFQKILDEKFKLYAYNTTKSVFT